MRRIVIECNGMVDTGISLAEIAGWGDYCEGGSSHEGWIRPSP